MKIFSKNFGAKSLKPAISNYSAGYFSSEMESVNISSSIQNLRNMSS